MADTGTVPGTTTEGIIPSIKRAWQNFTDTSKEPALKPITGTIAEQRTQVEAVKNRITPAKIAANTQELSNISTIGHATAFMPKNTQNTAGYMGAYRSADYNAQPTRELQNVALKGYITKLGTSPEFQGLSPQNQDFVLKTVFQKSVLPLLTAQGIKPPTYEMWKTGVNYVPEQPTATKTGTAVASLASGIGDDVDIAANIIHKTYDYIGKFTGLDRTETNQYPEVRYLERIANNLHQVDTDYYSNFQPLDTYGGMLANMAGSIPGWVAAIAAAEYTGGTSLEALAPKGALELTETAAEMRGTGLLTKHLLSFAERTQIGTTGSKVFELERALKLAQGAGDAGQVTALEGDLHAAQAAYKTSKVANLTVRTMIDATEVGGVDVAAGKSKEEAEHDARNMLILGPVLHGVFWGVSKIPVGDAALSVGGKLRKVAMRMAKTGGAKEVLGGEGMVNAVSEAATQVQNGATEIHIPASRADRVMSLVKEDDPDFIKLVQNEIKSREQVAQTLHPDKAEKFPGKVWNNLSTAQRAKVIAHMDMLQKQGAAEMLPLAHPVEQTRINAANITEQAKADPKLAALLNGIAGQGKDGVAEAAAATTKAQANKVAVKYNLKPKPTAAVAAVLRSKGFSSMEEASNAVMLPKELEKSSPRYRDKQLKFEDDRDKALYTVARDFTKSESDNPNSAAHFKFLSWLKQVAPNLKHPEIVEGRQVRARVKALAGKSPDEVVTIPRSEFWNKKAESSAEYTESVAERNARTEYVEPSSEALQDYEPQEGAWAEYGESPKISALRMSGASNAKASAMTSAEKLLAPSTNSEDFVYLTRKFLPNSGATKSGKIFFENPEHHLLYIATKKGLGATEKGKAIQDKAFRILGKEFSENRAVARERASWLDYHIDSLKATPHYDEEGNIFNSTKLGPPADYTKSMRKLHREVTAEELGQISAALAKSDPALAAAYTRMIKAGASVERNVRTAKQASKARAINAAVSQAIGDF